MWRFMKTPYNAFVMGKYEDSWKFNANKFVNRNMKIHGNSNANEFVMRNVKIHWNWVECICNVKCDEHVV
jgi:hypothetical protein